MLKYVEGDLFDAIKGVEGTVVIPHVCNDIGAWGAGFVIPLGKAFPKSKQAYQYWCYGHGGGPWQGVEVVYPTGAEFALGGVQMVNHLEEKVVVCNMVAQHKTGGVRPLRYDALAACMSAVGLELRNHHDKAKIFCPMFGSGLAGGNWQFIHELIKDCWDEFDVTVCYLPQFLPDGWTPPT